MTNEVTHDVLLETLVLEGKGYTVAKPDGRWSAWAAIGPRGEMENSKHHLSGDFPSKAEALDAVTSYIQAALNQDT